MKLLRVLIPHALVAALALPGAASARVWMTPEWADDIAAGIVSLTYQFSEDYGVTCYPPTWGRWRHLQRTWKHVNGRGQGWKVIKCDFAGAPYAGGHVEGVIYLFGSGQRACTFGIYRNGFLVHSERC